MGPWQLYLANVEWLARDKVDTITPGMLPVSITPGLEDSHYEASIPAYAREAGREMQLAVKSQTPCYIVDAENNVLPMFPFIHPDTGDHWWIEKGSWEVRSHSKYHDAPSFHRPGGTVTLRIGDDRCKVNLYDPCLSAAEFTILLDDIKNWCWRMAIDESCYVTVEQDSEVRILTPEFISLAKDFLRHTSRLLELPHSELRESVEEQPAYRLRPNNHSLRFIAQRGQRSRIPGRATAQHYNTSENRFVYAMLIRITRILRMTADITTDSRRRYGSAAVQYRHRANTLTKQTTVEIDRDTYERNLQMIQTVCDQIQNLPHGCHFIDINSNMMDYYGENFGYYNDSKSWCTVDVDNGSNANEINSFIYRHGAVRVYGTIEEIGKRCTKKGISYCVYRVAEKQLLVSPRKYVAELHSLLKDQEYLEKHNWTKPLTHDVIAEQNKEAKVLRQRARSLLKAARITRSDSSAVTTLLNKAISIGKRFAQLGVTPDLMFIPTMVFLQTPSYSGALSSYRQFIALAGIDEDALEGLLALENIGLRDWPGIYERWCLVSLLRVLQDDFRFRLNDDHVRDSLLKYCTGQEIRYFSVNATRKDMQLGMTLECQRVLANNKRPDFILTIHSNTSNSLGLEDAGPSSISCVLDAKACNFRRRPPDADSNPMIYLDDSLRVLLEEKHYDEGGTHRVFIMHASQNCISEPTTLQSWARSSAYGGDKVFAWETERPVHTHGAIQLRLGDTTNLKRLVLMLIQYGLQRDDICPSCGSGGSDIKNEASKGWGQYHRCTKCNFLSVRSHCCSCKRSLVKNQAWWTYHDLHPSDIWNIKCSSCGAIL